MIKGIRTIERLERSVRRGVTENHDALKALFQLDTRRGVFKPGRVFLHNKRLCPSLHRVLRDIVELHGNTTETPATIHAPIAQIDKRGKRVAVYQNVTLASRSTKIPLKRLLRALARKNAVAAGCTWARIR